MTIDEKMRALFESRICIVASCYNAAIVDRLIHKAAEAVNQAKAGPYAILEGAPLKVPEVCDGGTKGKMMGDEESGSPPARVSPIEVLCKATKLDICYVPGAYEIPQAAQMLASRGLCDAIIALGCVIRGGTAHFDAIADACTAGLNRVALDFTMPVGHGVLLLESRDQAEPRAESRGAEAAWAVMNMLKLSIEIDAKARNEG